MDDRIEDAGPRVALLLCEDLASGQGGLDLEGLRRWPGHGPAAPAVEVVPSLCGAPSQLSAALRRTGAERAVLGLCSRAIALAPMQAEARRGGLDPLGVQAVPLGSLCAAVRPPAQALRRARVLLAGALAGARAFEGSEPHQSRPFFVSLDGRMSRRALFSVPPIAYRPLPSVRHETCASGPPCRACLDACPHGALTRAIGRVTVDPSRCRGCGVCLAVCPRDAFDFPGHAPARYAAQVSAMLQEACADGGPAGFVLACDGGLMALESLGGRLSPAWYPVGVPCLGMVTPGWLLQVLAMGADSVAVLSCGGECPSGQGAVGAGRADFARSLLAALGLDPGMVRLLDWRRPEEVLTALAEPPASSPVAGSGEAGHLAFGRPEATADAVGHLAQAGGREFPPPLRHDHSPFGVVEFRPDGCHGCFACAQACPTGAMAADEVSEGRALTWLGRACTGCGLCVEACPEPGPPVVSVHRATDTAALQGGRRTLLVHRLALCRGCGAPIAPVEFLERVQGALAGESEALRSTLGAYCDSCRGMLAFTGGPWAGEGLVERGRPLGPS